MINCPIKVHVLERNLALGMECDARRLYWTQRLEISEEKDKII